MTNKKQRPDLAPITRDDVLAFLESAADFSFEMRVLKQLRHLGFECEHGGTYKDPLLGKARQYDIRARRQVHLDGYPNDVFSLRLAVECTNLREWAPLLVHAVQRTWEEAYHDLLVRPISTSGRLNKRRISPDQSLYRPHEWVGKRADQVVRTKDGAGFQRSDSEAWAKIDQAVSSAQALSYGVAQDGRTREAHSIIPVVVVPDGRLWQVGYANDGTRVEEPELVPFATYFLNREWQVQSPAPYHDQASFSVSHVELVTETGLAERVKHLTGWKGPFGHAEAVVS